MDLGKKMSIRYIANVVFSFVRAVGRGSLWWIRCREDKNGLFVAAQMVGIVQ